MATSKRELRESKKLARQADAKSELRSFQAKRRKRDNIIGVVAIAVAIGIAVTLQLSSFSTNPSAQDYASASASLGTSASSPATASSSASPSVAPGNGDNIPKPDAASSKTLTGTLKLNDKELGIEIDGQKAPQAAAVIKSLSDQNFYNGKNCDRITTLDTFSMIYCGSKNGDGLKDPAYLWGPVENSPESGIYPAGTIAMTRGGDSFANGTSFFITYKDTTIPLDGIGYTIVGKVTSGLDSLTAFGAAGAKDGATNGAPASSITIDSFKLN